jgi:AcrR family transcriptional regulator
MQRPLGQIVLRIDSSLYLKDPIVSDIGRQILQGSIELISDHGLEAFTFKKLALHLKSTESTIYRYFQNKHQLMMYLASWYWYLLEYQMAFSSANIVDPKIRLECVLQSLISPLENDEENPQMDVSLLQRIVIAESFKAFVVKSLDSQGREGYFKAYKQLCERLAEMLATYPCKPSFPMALATTIVETIHHQKFLHNHLPEFSDKTWAEHSLYSFIHQLTFSSLTNK